VEILGQQRVIGKSPVELKALIKNRKRKQPNAKLSDISFKLGQLDRSSPEWLILTDKSKLPQPDKVAYPKPPKAPGKIIVYVDTLPKSIKMYLKINLLCRRLSYL